MRAKVAFAFGAVCWVMSVGAVAGCSQNPLPPVFAAPQSCSGNPCGALNCPAAYTCRVDGRCVARCEAEGMGNKPF